LSSSKFSRSLPHSRSQRGLSIIELMVGVAIGMFVIGGAIKLFVDMFGNNRRLLIESRVNQDLRATADIIARDLRRAGYWQGASAAFNAAPGSAPALNPFADANVAATSITYAYDRGAGASAAGFSFANNQIYMVVGGALQPLTDPATVRITRFEIANSASTVQWADLAQHCPCVGLGATAPGGCSVAAIVALPEGSASRPQVGARWVDIIIEGEATTASAVRRQVVESVRLRNDQLRGACP
jgi:prepilin peptidase dependent protein B